MWCAVVYRTPQNCVVLQNLKVAEEVNSYSLLLKPKFFNVFARNPNWT
jgi:hypothetical protein